MNTTLPLIPLADLDAVLQPIGSARGMPGATYTDPALFAFERDHVMAQTWAALAFDSDLPVQGSVKPVDFMGMPLLVLRNRSGEVRVFHNICSHRGMTLVTMEYEVQGVIRCPYHSWTYDLDGNLQGTPHIGGVGIHEIEDFDCADKRLKAVRCATWMGIVFINLSDEGPAFADFIEPLASRWHALTGPIGMNELRLAGTNSTMELTIEANWKLAVENYCEAYHLPWVHPALNTYSPLSQHYNLVVDEHLSGQGTNSYTLSQIAGFSLPQFAHWPADKIKIGEYLSLYPNVLLGIQADHFFAILLQPVGPSKTLERLQISYIGEDAIGDAYAACRAAVMDSWKVVFGEDVFAVQGMQRGRESPGFRGGAFSPVMDVASHHFHTWVATRYRQAVSPGK